MSSQILSSKKFDLATFLYQLNSILNVVHVLKVIPMLINFKMQQVDRKLATVFLKLFSDSKVLTLGSHFKLTLGSNLHFKCSPNTNTNVSPEHM